jgi:dTMP kinase
VTIKERVVRTHRQRTVDHHPAAPAPTPAVAARPAARRPAARPTGNVVAIVGVDGAGKTTQAQLLAAWLTANGHRADYWQNAGGRRWFGRLARHVGLRDAQGLLGVGGMLLIESILRWLAIARALVRSKLRRRIAIMDRYSWCQYASIRAHGAASGVPDDRRTRRREWLARRLYGLYPEPDLTCFLALSPGQAYARIEARGTDHEDLAYLTAADAAYRSLPESSRFVVIDANRSPAEVHRAIQAAVSGFPDKRDEILNRPVRAPIRGA